MTGSSENDPTTIRRPRLLGRAARFGLVDYVRDRDLRRVFGAAAAPPRPGRAIAPLMAREALMESDRKAGSAAYSAARHVQVLTALMAESRLCAAPLS